MDMRCGYRWQQPQLTATSIKGAPGAVPQQVYKGPGKADDWDFILIFITIVRSHEFWHLFFQSPSRDLL